jgi:hypothetical protein
LSGIAQASFPKLAEWENALADHQYNRVTAAFLHSRQNSGFASNDGFLAGANTGFEADANDGFANSGFVADADDATNREDFFTQAAGFLDGGT